MPIKPTTLNQKIKPDEATKSMARFYGRGSVNAANALNAKLLAPGWAGAVSTNVPGSSEILKRYSDLSAQYAGRDPEQAGVVAGLKAGLGGYTSPEYQAQREQMQRGVDSNLATSLSQLAKAQARGKVYGAAGVAQQQNQMQAAQNTKDQLEQDLMVKNIDEKQRRQLEYGNYLEGLTSSEYDRQTGIEKDRTGTELALGQAELDREKINIGNKQAEVAARLGLTTGTLGQGYSKAENRAARRIQREAIRRMGGR